MLLSAPASRLALGLATVLVATRVVSAGPRLDQIQVIGTHNSYHVAPHPSLDALIRSRSPEQADSLAYSHRPLTEQLDRLGIRQIELDLYADPQGGLFAEPAGPRAAAARKLPPVALPNLEPLRAPGAKILHVPDFDFVPTVSTFRAALRELNTWSTNHPAHVPIFVLVELKQEAAGPEFTQPIPWTAALLDSVEKEILEILPPARLLRPDDLRGRLKTLREAVAGKGWPELAVARGRFVFLLDNMDATRDFLLSPNPNLAGRVFFASVDETHPAAAWFKVNDPIAEGARIQRLVRTGFLVRTRADADTLEARTNDPRRREAALASGAQLISTDYPEPNLSFSPYQVRFPGGVVARPNPFPNPGAPAGIDLEMLAPRGFEPFARAELEHLNRQGIAFHHQRRLEEASARYTRLLELDAPRPLGPERERVVAALCPVLHVLDDEPFPLRDLVALHHPVQPWIAYHLFWGDDIDFPEDNDPADHEIVWVSYDPATGRARRVFTYFHGEIVGADLRSAGETTRPQIAVEWGKHGSLPLAGDALVFEPPNLRRHWEQLHERGIRLPDHPLAADWPKRFERDWDAYRRFGQELDPQPLLEQPRHGWVSAWGNATINRYVIPYNFAAKPDWPE